jgi:hypothetical protein
MTNPRKFHMPSQGRVALIAAAVATAIMFAAPTLDEVFQNDALINSAVAAQHMGGKASAADQMGGKQGGQSGLGGYRQGQSSLSKILAEDEDSDRPSWAGGDKEENPHRGDGSAGSDTQKGGDYGDLWIVLRDDNGLPILDANGNVQPCLDAACTETIQLTADGELPPEYADAVIEVEFGRLNIARSPASVLEHSLVEALSKLDGLTLDDPRVTLDESGRLTIDGATIDSPLENLAIYEALLTAEAVDGVVTLSVTTNVEGAGAVTYTFSVPESVRLDLAASAIAAASDKTGELSVDEVVNISKFLEVDDELAALVGSYTYDRDTAYADVYVTYLVPVYDSNGTVIGYDIETKPVLETVEFNDLPLIDGDSDGIDRFAQAADDSVQVLEFVHDNAVD